MEDKQVVVNFALSEQNKKKIDAIAIANYRNFSQQMRLLVDNCIEENEQSINQ